MAAHDAVAALGGAAGTAAANKLGLRNLLESRMAYVLNTAAEATSLVPVDPIGGAFPLVLILLGRNFYYDSTDTSTAQDGVTCLVTSDGKRYKLALGYDVVVYSVINNTTTVPPGSPAIGDAYLVAIGGTGLWGGRDNQIAVWTVRGWEFVIPAVGRLIYVTTGANADRYYHKNAGGTWVLGFGSQAIPANSLTLATTINFGYFVIVENQTTNAPPGSPTVGQAYIIGPSPTGTWSGSATKVAICEVAGFFTIYTPPVGMRAYDKAQGQDYQYLSTPTVITPGWYSAGGNLSVITTPYFTAGSFTHTKAARLVYLEVWVTGAGGAAGAALAGGNSSFGSTQCAATGGAGNGGAAGVGSNGDILVRGGYAVGAQGGAGGGPFGGGQGPVGNIVGAGFGMGGSGATGAGGAGGGAAFATLLAAAVAGSTAVVVGARGNGGNAAGADGMVWVREYVRA